MMEVRGLSVHVQVLAPEQRAAGTVVLLHGLLVGSMAGWYFGTAGHLARSRRVVLYDLRGHGKSQAADSGYDLASLSLDLGALLERLDIHEAVDLVGHSYGAAIALRRTIDRPEGTRRLVLADPPIPPSSLQDIDALAAKNPDQLLDILPGPLRRAMQQRGRRAGRFVHRISRLLDHSTLLRDLKAQPDFSDGELARIRCKTLAIFGDRSPCRAAAPRLRERIPDLTLRGIDAGHFLPMEAPDELTAHIAAFLDAPDALAPRDAARPEPDRG